MKEAIIGLTFILGIVISIGSCSKSHERSRAKTEIFKARYNYETEVTYQNGDKDTSFFNGLVHFDEHSEGVLISGDFRVASKVRKYRVLRKNKVNNNK